MIQEERYERKLLTELVSVMSVMKLQMCKKWSVKVTHEPWVGFTLKEQILILRLLQ